VLLSCRLTIYWSRTAASPLRSVRGSKSGMPFTPEHLFSAAVAQQTVMRRHTAICLLLLLGSCPPSRGGCVAWSRDTQYFKQQTIYFETHSSLAHKDAKRQIAEVANFLKSHTSAAVQIAGHCDDRGSEEHNRWLGERRAQAVAKELAHAGVAGDRIDTISYGKDRPVESGHSRSARQKNRRVEFVLLTPPK
jgi:outer membrane protein OmpA-like peptidoglycan-associated protein